MSPLFIHIQWGVGGGGEDLVSVVPLKGKENFPKAFSKSTPKSHWPELGHTPFLNQWWSREIELPSLSLLLELSQFLRRHCCCAHWGRMGSTASCQSVLHVCLKSLLRRGQFFYWNISRVRVCGIPADWRSRGDHQQQTGSPSLRTHWGPDQTHWLFQEWGFGV